MGAMLAGGIVLLASNGGNNDQFCTMEGILTDTPLPAGWDLQRDHANDCQWTMFDEAGDRAPAELYAGQPVDPPSAVPPDWSLIGGTVLIIGALIGIAIALVLPRGQSPTST